PGAGRNHYPAGRGGRPEGGGGGSGNGGRRAPARVGPRAMSQTSPGALSGLTVLVTRPTEQASRLSTALADEGAEILELPTIQIVPPSDWAPVDAAIQAGHYDWVVFTSVNGVKLFFERLYGADRGVEWFDQTRVAAIGPE